MPCLFWSQPFLKFLFTRKTHGSSHITLSDFAHSSSFFPSPEYVYNLVIIISRHLTFFCTHQCIFVHKTPLIQTTIAVKMYILILVALNNFYNRKQKGAIWKKICKNKEGVTLWLGNRALLQDVSVRVRKSVRDVIHRLASGFLSGQAGCCCGPWENSSGEQVNMSQRLLWASIVGFLSHVPI